MKKIVIGAAALVTAFGAAAQTEPFNLSLTPDVAVHDRITEIRGITLSLWGENPQHSFALGLVNGTTGNSAGLSVGILNYADGYKGLQWGVVNHTEGDFTGWQGGPFAGLLGSAVNYAGGTMKGLQVGGVNMTGNLTGLQVGLVNYTKGSGPGIQIGLVNMMPENIWFDNLPEELAPAMILVNWRF
ncbi:LA_2272 family surface repeat-containing protein [Tichowtungia aerotolerans]|uniref:Uncharacterized protein n=1 Tax=Tichowtungia aerotolerans TaxID=2697043 RepID=A0A6P1M2Q0_9BACT|nr:hypothetical protein [Tichowtungia aerotolerans]QHI68107.1 hypothetical protein GT409_01110 [Tichowtungia aerotolerans]